MSTFMAFITAFTSFMKCLPQIMDLMNKLIEFVGDKQKEIALNALIDAFKKAQSAVNANPNPANPTAPSGNTGSVEGFFQEGGKP